MRIRFDVSDLHSTCNGNLAGANFSANIEVFDDLGKSIGVSEIKFTGNTLALPKLDGSEISPGIWLIGEPSPIAGTNKLRGLADVSGRLCTVELQLRFSPQKEKTE